MTKMAGPKLNSNTWITLHSPTSLVQIYFPPLIDMQVEELPGKRKSQLSTTHGRYRNLIWYMKTKQQKKYSKKRERSPKTVSQLGSRVKGSIGSEYYMVVLSWVLWILCSSLVTLTSCKDQDMCKINKITFLYSTQLFGLALGHSKAGSTTKA